MEMSRKSILPIIVCLALWQGSAAFAQEPACDTADADGGYADFILEIEGGAQGFSATNPASTATGAYQFLFKTLGDLGYIDLPRSREILGRNQPPFGEGNWEGVVWNGQDGIYSREQFMASRAAQDNALRRFTEDNLRQVEGHWTPGQVVNGIPLTAGGVAAATHLLGTGGFQQWAASGFSPSGLNADFARSHAGSQEAWQEAIMRRVARGGCFDPGDIRSTGGDIGELPEIFLMPWTPRLLAPIIMPGQLRSTAI
jgi:hypothetical protein